MRAIGPVLFVLALALAAPMCRQSPRETASVETAHRGPQRSTLVVEPAEADTAVFAMGCFWCAETAFEGLDGIAAVTSGFAGGTVPNPTYDQVTAGGTGHFEAVEVVYAPAIVDYATLLRLFWHNIDPVDEGGQFCDRGDSYRSAVFALTRRQRIAADSSRQALEESGRFDQPLVTDVLPAAPFYPAEEYHQDFWLKDPDRYSSYRTGCRRDARLEEVWGERARIAGNAL